MALKSSLYQGIMDDESYLDAKGKIDSVIDTVVLIEAYASNGKARDTFGGVCVSGDGLIVTVEHGLWHIIPDTIRVLFPNDSTPKRAHVVYSFPEIDVAVLRLTDWETGFDFKHVVVPENICLDWADRVFSFSHSKDFYFSPCFGRVAYPFAREVEVPELYLLGKDRDHNFDATAINHCVPYLKSKFCPQPDKILHPDLPIIKTHGLNFQEGSSGCPLFRRSQKRKLLGICSYGTEDSLYFIPSPVIAKALQGYSTLA